jgi:hypothetical protein
MKRLSGDITARPWRPTERGCVQCLGVSWFLLPPFRWANTGAGREMCIPTGSNIGRVVLVKAL